MSNNKRAVWLRSIAQVLNCKDGQVKLAGILDCARALDAAEQLEQRDALLEACKAAMRIVELWCPALPRHADDVHEFQALQSMRKKLRAAIALAEQEPTP